MVDMTQFNLGTTSQLNLLTSFQKVHDDDITDTDYHTDNSCETKTKQVVKEF